MSVAPSKIKQLKLIAATNLLITSASAQTVAEIATAAAEIEITAFSANCLSVTSGTPDHSDYVASKALDRDNGTNFGAKSGSWSDHWF